MDCAISVFGGNGIVSFLLFLLVVMLAVFNLSLYFSLKEMKMEIEELKRRSER